MYCGSCLRDNALAAGLTRLGWDVTLLPLYTPIRVDEEDRSVDQVFFGGINVFLQQKIPLFRHLPAFLDRWLDNPRLIRRVASGALSVSAKELGSMTLSMVKGEDGFQRKEVARKGGVAALRGCRALGCEAFHRGQGIWPRRAALRHLDRRCAGRHEDKAAQQGKGADHSGLSYSMKGVGTPILS